MDIFSIRFMLAVLEQLYPPKTFLLDTFFPNVETSTSQFVDIDVVKGKRRLAPFVNRRHEGKVVDRIGYTTNTFQPPYIKLKMRSDIEDILKRMPGNTIYQGASSPMERASQQLAKDLAEMQDMVTRREEWMASQALENGKIIVKGDGFDAEIDFLMDASHKIQLAGTDLWSDANSDPIGDLREWSDKVGEDSGLNPDVAVLGADSAKKFLDHSDVRELLDNRRIQMGQIDPRQLPDGAIFLGSLKDPALDLYRYNEFYFDEDAGILKPMVPKKKVFIGSTRARTARHYGAILDWDFYEESGVELASVRWFPKSWRTKDPSERWLLLQSAAVVAMHQPDAFLVATVL